MQPKQLKLFGTQRAQASQSLITLDPRPGRDRGHPPGEPNACFISDRKRRGFSWGQEKGMLSPRSISYGSPIPEAELENIDPHAQADTMTPAWAIINPGR